MISTISLRMLNSFAANDCSRAGSVCGPKARMVAARRVDRPAVLPSAEAANGVELLQAKTQGIDHAVAGPAGRRLGLQRHALARRQVRVQLGRERGESGGGRLQYPSQHIAG